LWINTPLLCLAAHQADGTLGILEWAAGGLLLRFTGAARDAVFQNDPRDTLRIEPGGDLFAFELPVQIPVAAARADHDGCAAVFLFGWKVHGNARPGHVGDHPR